MQAPVIMIGTIGVLHVASSDGDVLTPPGARLRAIIAILALTPRKRIARRKLETLLWPESNDVQASNNLRQALANLRKHLGPHKRILLADRSDVALDPAAVQVDIYDAPQTAFAQLSGGAELLDGLDLRSEEFDDWLRQERATLFERLERTPFPASAPTLVQPQPIVFDLPRLYADPRGATDQLDTFIAESICAQLAQTAVEHARTDVILMDGAMTPAVLAPGSRCTVRVTQQGDRMHALARLTMEPSGKQIWSRRISFSATDELEAIDVAASLALEATEAHTANQPDAGAVEQANALAAKALGDVFSFDPARLRNADHLLAQAHAIDPYAPRPALRALAKAFLALEDSSGDPDVLQAEADHHIAEALRLDGDNPVALAFIADVHDLVFRDPHTALSYAKRALQANPGTGYAYASLGGLELRRGNGSDAILAATRARRQLENTSLQVFALMRFCVAAMTVGNFDAATEAAHQASLLAPNSSPPLRHLYALQLYQGNREGARDARRALRRLDPEFSMQRLREDPHFPAATIRAVGLDQLQDVDL